MNTLTKIGQQARKLVDQYGPEVSICARVAVSTLLPAGAVLAESIGGLCDYVSDRRLELSHQKTIELLGALKDDQDQVSRVMGILLKQLNPLMEQLMETQHIEGLDHDQLITLMKRQCITSLSTQEKVAEVQSQLLKIQPELSFIKEKSAQLLKTQESASEEMRAAIEQVRTLVDTMYSYSVPLDPKELSTQQRKAFYLLHARFQDQFLVQDVKAMEEIIEEMKTIAPYNPMTSICEAALASVKSDFEYAQEVMNGLPDELTEGALKSVKEAIDVLSPKSSAEGDTFVNEAGEVCFGGQGWRQVPEIDEAAFSLENLAQGWLLHTRPSRKATQWTVMSVNGEPGALHVIKGQLTRRGDYYKRLKDELSSLKAVDHPAVLQVLDWGRTPTKDPYMVTEPLQSETLEDRMARGRLSPNEMKALGNALFESLHACHKQGILHLNIHPCNIQFRADNTPVLTGFGVSCQELELDIEGNRSDPYASPEQLNGEQLTPATDIYSLGSILIDSVGGLGSVPKAWRPSMSQFVDPLPSSRPSASEVINTLQTFTAKYYVQRPQRASQGPFEVSKIVELILDEGEDLMVQRAGSLMKEDWRLVSEISLRVEEAKEERERQAALLEARRAEEPLQDVFNPQKMKDSIKTKSQPERVLKEYEKVAAEGKSGFRRDDSEKRIESVDVLMIGEHKIDLHLEDGDLRTSYIRGTDAEALLECDQALNSDDSTFLTSLKAQANVNGELTVSKEDAQRFLKLTRTYLASQSDPRSETLSMMRAGGKGPFQLVIRG